MNALQVFVGLFSSRKNQVGAGTAISIILAAIGFRDYPPEVIATIIGALATLGAMIINGIKAEDVAAKTAAGMVAAANVTAQTAATTTTGSTPGTSDVSVKSGDLSETAAPTPTQPIVERQGLL
jgi:hypothetical protein